MKAKVAIVVQRCHPDVVGGSEALAMSYATLLAVQHDVEILTTATTDAVTWENNLPPGQSVEQGVKVSRYPVSIGRSSYWHQLHRHLLTRLEPDAVLDPGADGLTAAFQHEFIRQQGPHSEPLLVALRQRWDEFQRVIFVTYLYSPTFFGSLEQPDLSSAWLVPTLHDEAAARLPVFRQAYRRFSDRLIWLTEAERRIGQQLWGAAGGAVLGMPVEEPAVSPRPAATPPYLFYCGRIDEYKGCSRLVEWFSAYRKTRRSNAELRLAGTLAMEEPGGEGIRYLGRLERSELEQQMAGATGFILPSRWESFSIALLEAMSLSVPCIVDRRCEVTVDHVTAGCAGSSYASQSEFDLLLDDLLARPQAHREEVRGRDYVRSRYARPVVAAELKRILDLA